MSNRRRATRGAMRLRAPARRMPLQMETLESRCMLAADADVAMDVIIPADCCLPCPEVMVECMPYEWMNPMPIDDINVVLPIDEAGVMGEPDFTDLMFFSMGSDGGEGIPFDETMAIEDVMDFVSDGSIDPMIYSSFPPMGEGDGEGEGQQPVDEPVIEVTIGWVSVTDDLAAIPEADGGFEIPAEAFFSSGPSEDDSSPEPTPAAVEATPRARAFAAFAKSQGSFTNLFLSAQGSFGTGNDGVADGGFAGGRRRARR